MGVSHRDWKWNPWVSTRILDSGNTQVSKKSVTSEKSKAVTLKYGLWYNCSFTVKSWWREQRDVTVKNGSCETWCCQTGVWEVGAMG